MISASGTGPVPPPESTSSGAAPPRKQLDPAVDPPGQPCRAAAAEHNDGITTQRDQVPAVTASAPLIRAASAAARKRSISPSSTPPVFEVSTPVRKSLTI